MKANLRFGFALLAAAIAACSEATGPRTITALPRPLSSAEAGLVGSANQFSIGLFKETLHQSSASDNVFISPLSFSMALGMALNGAANATESSMAQTLALDGASETDINNAYHDLVGLLTTLDPSVTMTIANSIWYRQNYVFSPAFLATNQQYFDATVQGLDFNSPAAAQTINGWVNDRTSGRIPSIVPANIPTSTIMYLVNAVYFKANWTKRFDPSLTSPGVFYLEGGGTSNVPMMHSDGEIPARRYADAVADIVDLPYGGDAFSMMLILPANGLPLDSLVSSLTPQRWQSWTTALKGSGVLLVMPKFTMTYTLDSAQSILQAMGMRSTFCSDPAAPPPDFSRLYSTGGVCISQVRHKTFVLVDESGTEAAAATSVGLGPTSAPLPFIIDRPFLFAIRERFSGTILFIGRVMNPATVN
ncbi:MAG TPA: serpin family protein [Gemmatimonadales bacterium]|jgi:serpin B